MCGIAGIATTPASPAPQEALVAAMCDALVHRGPDDAGLWTSPDRATILGSRRLAIIDLSPAGHQPMANEQNDIAIAFNGEIYNFRELRKELETRGHRFRGHSDTEVILRAYEQWGEACFERLNGMFAIALYDRRRNVVVLARDRAGEKPLFYHANAGRLAFASELKALLVDTSLPRKIEPEALQHFLAYGFVPRELCILREFRKLPPAHLLRFDLKTGAIEVRAYWQLTLRMREPGNEVEELESLLADSVRHQLIADVPVGILLSGGVDSSLVTAFASREAGARVKTFTVSFPGAGEFDEAPFARAVAAHFGTEHHELSAQPASVELLPLLARQFDEPIADSSLVPTFLLARAVKSEVKVALGGDGGDELFGGYPYYSVLIAEDRLARRIPDPILRASSSLARLAPRRMRGRARLIALAGSAAKRYAGRNQYFDPIMRSCLLGTSDPKPEGDKAGTGSGTVLQQATAADFLTYLPDDILVKVDRASMLASLEVRAPFLDRRIIEFAFSLPDELRATAVARKVILRRLAARVLPGSFDAKRKRGFSVPLEQWFEPFSAFARAILLDDAQQLFHRDVVENLFAGGHKQAHRVFALTMLELWRREYGVTI